MSKEKTRNRKYSHPLPWIAGVLLLVAAAVWGGLYWNRTSSIERVEFEGYHYVSLKVLQNKVDIPKGIHPDSLSYKTVVNQVMEIPYVEKVRLKLQPSGTMVVEISERQPVALLLHNSNRCYVDSNGVKLPMKGVSASVPILYGFQVQPLGDTLTSDAFNKVSAFLQRLLKNPASNATISSIAWNNDKGVVALTNNSAVRLVFGRDEYRKKLRNWEAFYAQVVRYKGIDHFQTVNLTFEGQIVTHEDE